MSPTIPMAEAPPSNRRVIGEFWTDPSLRTRTRLWANLLGFTILAAIVLLGFGWAIFLEPSATLRDLAAATIVAALALGAASVSFAHRSHLRRQPIRALLTDWGVEFDAPTRRPDLQPPESGGALSWEHVGSVEILDGFWAAKWAGAHTVCFLSPEFRREPYPAMTIPRLWPWAICIPYLPSRAAEQMIGLAKPFIRNRSTMVERAER